MNALSRIRIARDHNRGLVAPVRWAHFACAALADLVAASRDAAGWLDAEKRRPRAWTIVLLALAAAILPFDGVISAWFERHRPRGDLRRELEALQQFGQFAMSMVVVAAVWLLDRPRARRLLDWLAGAVVCGVAITVLKVMVGRPRPSLGDPFYATGPAGMYPVPVDGGYRMASSWTSSYDLASFPSRHACFAALAAVFLCRMAPKLRPLAVALAMIVATARVVTGAHYPSDVLAGAAVGYGLGVLAIRGAWGVKLVDRLWKRLVDPFATPALPRLEALDHGR